MKTLHIFIIFIIVVIAQLFIPTKMILDQEDILETGTVYKFRTQPVDPSDPFRGKYITLRYDIDSVESNDTLWTRNEDVYVYIKKDNLGFAELYKVSKELLDIENDYVIAKVNWYNKKTKKVSFNLLFDRFYMEESKAKPAEDAYRKAQRDSLPKNIYGLVYIKDGDAVLKDVIVNDVSIAKYVEE